MAISFDLRVDPVAGLLLDFTSDHMSLARLPLRATLSGSNTFKVWGAVDSGEEPPAWAEDLRIDLLGPGSNVRIERFTDGGRRAIGVHERAVVVVDARVVHDQLAIVATVTNPQGPGGKPLPLCLFELRLEDLTAGPDSEYACAHAYGGGTHGWGRLSELENPGVIFVHGCIGQALPLVCLHSPSHDAGVMFEFMQDGRPIAWLRPGSSPDRANWAVTFSTHRLLTPGQSHVYSPPMMISGFAGKPWQAIGAWRDRAALSRGLTACPTPRWVRHSKVIEFNMSEKNVANGFTRLDDPKCREMMKRWRDMGYDAIFCVAQFKSIHGWLSPVSYDPKEDIGGFAAEATCLRWMHELGFKPFLWVTTVGIDRDAPEVAKHPDWFTHRRNGEFFYAWDSGPANGYLGYAPDGDATSSGWRAWMKDQVKRVIDRGYDGVFIDGCIPRADNHAKWFWPGEGRNAVEDQVLELARYMRTLGSDRMTFVEDESPAEQALCELTQGRYHTCAPFFKKAYWDHGMMGGPGASVVPPSRIPPELAREYLLLRYASLLPGVVSSDVIEGYFSEEARPWVVQAMLAGVSFKTHNQYVDFPDRWQPFGNCPEPPEAEKDPQHRRRGHAEFLSLLKLLNDEPELLRDAPRTIAGVEIEGDAAVVGILRPSRGRCILALLQFARREANVSVRLVEALDLPSAHVDQADRPQGKRWTARELMHSMVDRSHEGRGSLGTGETLRTTIAACGFRIFELVAQ